MQPLSLQVWHGRRYDASCDMWSAGAVLYEMMTLRPPMTALSLAVRAWLSTWHCKRTYMQVYT